MRGLTRLATLAALAAVAVLLGCADPSATVARSAQASNPTHGPNVVHFAGTEDLAFGVTSVALTSQGLLDTGAESCGPRLPGRPALSPVFDEGRLVLLWAYPPAHTPEGVAVGASVAEVLAAYPQAQRLTAPEGSYRFAGLLVESGDRAYLFLHDGSTVQKTIVGYTDYARRLFDEGFGTC